MKQTALQNQPDTANWMNDFSIFVSRKAPSTIGFILCILWCIGIFLMLIKLIQSIYHFHAIKKSALPLQNPTVNRLYQNCLAEMQLKKAYSHLQHSVFAFSYYCRIIETMHIFAHSSNLGLQ